MTTPILEALDLTKTYGSVEALRGASFSVHAGEVVALIGDNGAGKSTLVKCMVGAEQPTSGTLRYQGGDVHLESPTAARRLGIETVYQDLAVAPELDPAANLFLGREIRRPGVLGALGMLDKKAMRRKASKEFGRLGVRPRRSGTQWTPTRRGSSTPPCRNRSSPVSAPTSLPRC